MNMPTLEEGLQILHLLDSMGGFDAWYRQAPDDNPYKREIDRIGLEAWRRED